jgi:nicotinate-nucleotide pyrophosphorylase (carboxylating)
MLMIKESVEIAVRASLEEDIGSGDITAELLPTNQMVRATIITNEVGVFCGTAWAEAVYQLLDSNIKIHWHAKDGDKIQPKQLLAELSGNSRSLITGERCALNWLQTLSGTASKVALYAEKLAGTNTRLLDTRKTIPGLRYAQKYAVKCGGGHNHRMGLYDAYLIKENHIISCGSIKAAMQRARDLHADKPIEIEVENLDELQQALAEGATLILLDNFAITDIKKAVAINHGRAKLEVSGGVNLNNIRDIAETGVDFVSVGAITKHVRAIDLSMRFV